MNISKHNFRYYRIIPCVLVNFIVFSILNLKNKKAYTVHFKFNLYSNIMHAVMEEKCGNPGLYTYQSLFTQTD